MSEFVLQECCVRKVAINTTKKGDKFVVTDLKPLSGEIFCAKAWNATAAQQEIKIGDVVSVDGRWDAYAGTIYLNTSSLVVVPGDASLYIDRYDAEVYEKYKAKFKTLMASICNEDYKSVLASLLNEPFYENYYFVAPAASQFHHAELGGVLVHSVEVAMLCDSICGYNDIVDPELDRDLLITGALLHDIGKCYTYEFCNGVPILNKQEYLIGHSAKGMELIGHVEAALQMDCTFLKHLVASHQGEPNFGGVKNCATKEAQILHMADMISSRLYMFNSAEYVDGKVWSNAMKQYIFGTTRTT